METTLTIGQVARRAGVRTDTVRFYERRGLIPAPARRASGYRDFPEDTVRRIRFIKRAQGLGFTLDEVEQLLRLRASSRAHCADVLDIADHKMQLIEEKITDLQAMRRALRQLASACRGGKPVVECPIIESLERNNLPRRRAARKRLVQPRA
jgi:Hg(II)-responsive transcriptional regulator